MNLEFEETARKTYNQFASESTGDELKSTFKSLARSEAGHINIFRQMIKEIEDGNFPVVIYCTVCGWELDFGPSPAEGMVMRCPKCGASFELTVEDGDWILQDR